MFVIVERRAVQVARVILMDWRGGTPLAIQ